MARRRMVETVDALSDLAEVNPGGAVSAKVERPTMRIAREIFGPDRNNLLGDFIYAGC